MGGPHANWNILAASIYSEFPPGHMNQWFGSSSAFRSHHNVEAPALPGYLEVERSHTHPASSTQKANMPLPETLEMYWLHSPDCSQELRVVPSLRGCPSPAHHESVEALACPKAPQEAQKPRSTLSDISFQASSSRFSSRRLMKWASVGRTRSSDLYISKSPAAHTFRNSYPCR